MSLDQEIAKTLKQHGDRIRHLETVERSASGGGITSVEVQEDDAWVLDALIFNFEGGGGKVTDEGGGKATIDITAGAGEAAAIKWAVLL